MPAEESALSLEGMATKKRAGGAGPRRMKAYPSFAAWKRDQSAENQKLISALSRLVEKTCPDFVPAVKWGQGCWTLDDDPRVYIHAEPDHLHFGFHAGAKLKDPEGLLVGNGKYVRHVKVFVGRPIPRSALVELLEQVR